MKCREAQNWLLTLKADGPFPTAVQRHLEQCPRCRRLGARLARLDESVRQLPVPRGNEAARAGLWERIDASIRPRPVPPPRRSSWPVWRQAGLTVAAAAAILFVLGVLVGLLGRTTVMETPPLAEQETGPSAPGEAALVLRLAKYDVQLGKTTRVDEQLDVLGQVAGDLKDEALRRVRQGTATDVPLLAELYGRVVRDGIARRAVLLSRDKKPALLTALVRRLRETAGEVQTLAQQSLPVVAEMLQPLSKAARESADLVEAGRAPPRSAPLAPAGPRPVMAALVHQGLKLTEEMDPIRRADLCSELASLLAPTIVLLSESDEGQRAGELGACVGELLDQGVAQNLARAQANNLPVERRVEIERLQRHLTEAAAVLERNLVRVSPKAKVELQIAIDAFSTGFDRVERKIKSQGGRGGWPNHFPGHGPGQGAHPPGKQSFWRPGPPWRGLLTNDAERTWGCLAGSGRSDEGSWMDINCPARNQLT